MRNYLKISPHAEVEFLISKGQVVLVNTEKNKKHKKSRYSHLRGLKKDGLSTEKWMQATRGD